MENRRLPIRIVKAVKNIEEFKEIVIISRTTYWIQYSTRL